MSLAAFESQDAFRALMGAMSRPGTITSLEGKGSPSPLMPGTAALIASLADFETPVWLDPILASVAAVVEWIRFTTGAPLTTRPDEAAFALVVDADALPDFSDFAQGSEEYPDRSTTVIAQVERFSGHAFTLHGPGLKEPRSFSAEPLPADFAARWAANRALFPRGVDLILVAGARLAALPRSLRISGRG